MGLQRRHHAAKLTKHTVAWGIGKTIINLDKFMKVRIWMLTL